MSNPASSPSQDKTVFESKGQRVTPLHIWSEEAANGGVVEVDEGSSGACFVRRGRPGAFTVTLRPGAPNFSLWRLSDGRLVRLIYRNHGWWLGFDEGGRCLVASLDLPADIAAKGGDLKVDTPIGSAVLSIPRGVKAGETRIVDIVEARKLEWPRRLKLTVAAVRP